MSWASCSGPARSTAPAGRNRRASRRKPDVQRYARRAYASTLAFFRSVAARDRGSVNLAGRTGAVAELVAEHQEQLPLHVVMPADQADQADEVEEGPVRRPPLEARAEHERVDRLAALALDGVVLVIHFHPAHQFP